MFLSYFYFTLCTLLSVCPVFKILRLGLDQIEVQNDLRDLPHKALNLNYSSNDVQWNPKDGTAWPITHWQASPYIDHYRPWCSMIFYCTDDVVLFQ